jgi:hypothetical protein
VTDINEDFQLLLKASEEDDKKDDDKDGIADVDQLVRPEIIQNKSESQCTLAASSKLTHIQHRLNSRPSLTVAHNPSFTL